MSNSFKLKNKIAFTEINDATVLPESDLCFQDDQFIYQFEFSRNKDRETTVIEPGVYTLARNNGKIALNVNELRTRDLLTSVTNTSKIIKEADFFFNNLHVYEELGEQKARKILLYSDPGCGKTATMTKYCKDAIAQDPGTVVFIWPTSQIEASDVTDFMSAGSTYDPKCTRVIILMEDIGGEAREGHGGPRGVDADMLNFLDGLENVFKIPTLILATTNYPANIIGALSDRPGRFDNLMELTPPSYEERIALVEFMGKTSISEEDKQALDHKDVKKFSVAHLKEAVIRSRLHGKTLAQTIKEIIEHKAKYEAEFDKRKSIDLSREWD